MKMIRILARVLVVENDEILLVRNRGAKFWYPPGGGWEFETETILECAVREVAEETGYKVTIDRMLWLQEFHEGEKIFFETFWLARPASGNVQTKDSLARHLDLDPNGAVEEARWYKSAELQDLTIFPKRVKEFKKYIDEQHGLIDPFIGAFL